MNRELKLKIDELVANIGNKPIEDELINEAFALAMSPEDKREAGKYLMQAMAKRRRSDIDARSLMSEVTDAISLSYIAKKYFGKESAWLYQRLNRSIVNGKPASFSQTELTVLADALKDLSRKLSDTSTNISQSLN
jgi:hypothetical protein